MRNHHHLGSVVEYVLYGDSRGQFRPGIRVNRVHHTEVVNVRQAIDIPAVATGPTKHDRPPLGDHGRAAEAYAATAS